MKSVRLIAVEDERIVARDLKLRLTGMGYEVVANAASAEEAIELVGKQRPNIVLMDVHLKGEADGIRAAQIVRQRFDVPVVFLTAHADSETLQRASAAEPYGYILKPFDDRELKATIEVALYKHRAEKRLRETQGRLVLSQRIAHLGNWEQDMVGGRFLVSEEACRILALDRAGSGENGIHQSGGEREFSRDEMFARVDPAERHAVLEALDHCVSEGKPLNVEYRFMLPDGSERFVRQFGEVVVDYDGRKIRLLVTVQDITEYKHLEERLRRAQKLEAIGQLAGGVAHDFNNMLVIIKGYSEMILEEINARDPIYERLREILKAADRAAALTGQLLAFGRRQVMRRRVIDLNQLITDFEKFLRRLVPENVEIRKSLVQDLWTLKADPGQIEQVIMNLTVNARDAMPRGGVLTIATSNSEFDDTHVRSFPDIAPGRYISLSIADTGTGISPEVRGRLFEPFFTTKPPNEGTGLGLSTVYGVVKQHGGEISVYSEVGHGSVFRVYLPANEEGARESGPADSNATPYAGKETILLVEDDDNVRSLTASMLERQGYTVLVAAGGPDALDIAGTVDKPIDLVLTDLVMPRMSGVELARRMMSARPGIRFLFMSGYPGRILSDEGLSETDFQFLQKPFSINELGKKIRESLHGHRDETGSGNR